MSETFEILVVAPTEKQRRDWVNILGYTVSKITGGFSVYEGAGGWAGKNGVTLFEPHTRLIAYCPEDVCARELFNLMSHTISQYKYNCQQEVVLVVLNGEILMLENIPENLDL
ncbi:MAG: hypothetical protein KAJ73_09020 [Zetaproteobacteria bacterium]|nr:hypothetical protein [Zetaproteobacteria bacterium]